MRIRQLLLQRIALMMSVLVFLLTGVSGVQAKEWVAFEEGVAEGTPPEVTLIQSDQNGTIVDFAVYGMYREQQEENGEVFDVLEFTEPRVRGLERSETHIAGSPQVPTTFMNIALPPTSKVKANLDEASVETVKLARYHVYPYQPDYLQSEPPPPFTYDEAVYSADSFFPEEVIQLGDISILTGIRKVLVRLQPVHFNPVTGELMVYRSGRFVVEYYGISDDNIIENPRLPNPLSESSLRDRILNYDFILSLGYGVSSVSCRSWGSIKRLR